MPNRARKQLSGSSVGRENKHAGSIVGRRRSLDEGDLRTLVENKPEGLYLILDGIKDPHNLGAILRSADGAGVDAVITPRDRAVGITETVQRISVGASEHVSYCVVPNLARVMGLLSEFGVLLVGTSDQATQSLYQTKLVGGVALVIGSEEKGMRRLTMEHCDTLISLPMLGEVECLNASVATGICLYEAVRQRREIGGIGLQ